MQRRDGLGERDKKRRVWLLHTQSATADRIRALHVAPSKVLCSDLVLLITSHIARLTLYGECFIFMHLLWAGFLSIVSRLIVSITEQKADVSTTVHSRMLSSNDFHSLCKSRYVHEVPQQSI